MLGLTELKRLLFFFWTINNIEILTVYPHMPWKVFTIFRRFSGTQNLFLMYIYAGSWYLKDSSAPRKVEAYDSFPFRKAGTKCDVRAGRAPSRVRVPAASRGVGRAGSCCPPCRNLLGGDESPDVWFGSCWRVQWCRCSVSLFQQHPPDPLTPGSAQEDVACASQDQVELVWHLLLVQSYIREIPFTQADLAMPWGSQPCQQLAWAATSNFFT